MFLAFLVEAYVLLYISFQSLLRGRFLRTNERPVEDERPPSMAAGELVQLRQRHTVSGLRYQDTGSSSSVFSSVSKM